MCGVVKTRRNAHATARRVGCMGLPLVGGVQCPLQWHAVMMTSHRDDGTRRIKRTALLSLFLVYKFTHVEGQSIFTISRTPGHLC
jgi:hypothetical protein